MSFAFILAGLVLLVAGGDALVRGATGLARALGVSPLLVGLVVVGFGTSMPELTTSVAASLSDSPAVAVGNVVGSNIANILLILAVTALIAPVAVQAQAFGRDGPALAIASLVAAAVVAFLPFARVTGLALFAALIAYVVLSYILDTRMKDAGAALHAGEAETVTPAGGPLVSSLFLLAGLAGVVGGAALLVNGATTLAAAAGVSEAVIGLTIVAVGTSLPELAASVSAARKGQGDLAFGNVIGSNIFNALGILGVAAIARPFDLAPGAFGIDLLVMLAAAGALIVFALSGWRIDRREGAILLLAYAGYMAWLAVGQI
ncbi:MAG: calcium/sodium antiporter [Oceanicaulis sp.]